MARTIERTDGVTTERVTEGGPDVTYVETAPRGSGVGGVLAVVAVIAALAIAAFFFLNMTRNDNLRTESVSQAASSVAGSVGKAADNVGDAAQRAADNVTPPAR